MRTPLPGVFAAGNLVHPAETADSCALGGRHAAAAVAEHLEGETGWPAEHVRVVAGEGLRWVVPGSDRARAADRAPRDRFLLRSAAFLRRPRIEVVQGERDALARPPGAAGPRALGPHPGRVDRAGRPHGRPRDH